MRRFVKLKPATEKDDVSIYLYREETNNYYLAKDFDSELNGIGVALSVPLVYEGKMIGLMNLSDKKTKEVWTSRDLNLLNELSERIVWDLIEVQKDGDSKGCERCGRYYGRGGREKGK